MLIDPFPAGNRMRRCLSFKTAIATAPFHPCQFLPPTFARNVAPEGAIVGHPVVQTAAFAPTFVMGFDSS